MARLANFKLFHKNLVKDFGKSNFDNWITKTFEFIKKNEGSLDEVAGKAMLAGWYLAEGKFTELKHILDSLELTGDNLVDFDILGTLSSYYYGFNDPSINLDKAEEYYKKKLKIAKEIVFQDDWEKVYITSSLLRNKIYRTKDPNEILNLIDQILDNAAKYPGIGLGSNFQKMNYNDLGNFYRAIGKLDLAIQFHNASIEFSIKCDYSFMPISNLAYDYLLRNDLEKAKSTLQQGFSKFHESNNYWLKSMVLYHEAMILEQEQEFDKLEANLIRHLELASKTSNNLKILERKLNLMIFYNEMYLKTRDRQLLIKVKDLKDQMQQLAEINDIITIKRLNNYAIAFLYKNGTTRQKAQAMDLYEELVKIYPRDPKYKLDLIELYWEDLENDIEGENDVKNSIDKLLADIRSLPTMKGQTLDTLNVSYRILLAKYDFYINGNTKEALESLYALQSKAVSYGYKLIEERLNKEIALLEKDLDWYMNDLSLKERIDKIKFKSYIEGARSLIDADFKY